MFVLHRGESGVVTGVTLSLFGGMLAAAGELLALGSSCLCRGRLWCCSVVPPAWSRLQVPASSEQPSASYVPRGLPVRKTQARLRVHGCERGMQRSTCAQCDALSAVGVSKLLLTDSAADLPVLLNTILLLVF